MSKRTAVDAASSSAKKVKSAAITSFFKKDGVTQSSTPRNTQQQQQQTQTPFDRSDWLGALDERQKDLLALEIGTLDDSWLSVLHEEFTKPYFLKLKEFASSF